MTPQERTVLQVIASTLRGGSCAMMDAYATSYRVGDKYYQISEVRRRAATLLYALIEEDTINRRRKNGLDAHQK